MTDSILFSIEVSALSMDEGGVCQHQFHRKYQSMHIEMPTR